MPRSKIPPNPAAKYAELANVEREIGLLAARAARLRQQAAQEERRAARLVEEAKLKAARQAAIAEKKAERDALEIVKENLRDLLEEREALSDDPIWASLNGPAAKPSLLAQHRARVSKSSRRSAPTKLKRRLA